MVFAFKGLEPFLLWGFLNKLRDFFLLCQLFEIARVDKKRKRITNKKLCLLFFGQSVFLLLEYFLYENNFMASLNTAVKGLFFIGIGFGSVCFFTKGKIGAGDVKLFAVIGFYKDFETALWILFFTFLYAAFFCFVKRMNLKEELPLAPFAFWATATMMFCKI